VEDNSAGTGTISTNPAFRDTATFILEAGSPAIDGGHPDAADNDLITNTNKAIFPSRGRPRNDLGAYGGPNPQNPAAPFFWSNAPIFSKVLNSPIVAMPGDSRSVNWIDIDGDLDLFATNAFYGGFWKNFLFLNNGDGAFVRNLTEAPAVDQDWSYGCAFGDFDGDGDLDLGVANCKDASQPDYLYENHSAENGNHWIGVRCVGTSSNKSAIGAVVRAQATINGNAVTQMREISAQSGYCGQNQLAAHFGLGDATGVVISVKWPACGDVEVFDNISADQYVTIVEGQGITAVQEASQVALTMYPAVPNPLKDSIVISLAGLQRTFIKFRFRTKLPPQLIPPTSV